MRTLIGEALVETGFAFADESGGKKGVIEVTANTCQLLVHGCITS
jgi:hypothetical protein